jgi:cytochrome c oxidase assembly protein subunit 11
MTEVGGSGGGALDAAASRRARSNRFLAGGTAAFVLAMIGLTYAAAPFYSAFCRATGYEGTPQRVTTGASLAGRRTLTVTFDANVAPGLNWRLEPEQDSIRLRTGKTVTVFFRARNLSDKDGDANATFNVAPEVSGGYFDKISCFCFSTQHLSPHETAEWPVVFYLDPALETDTSMANVDSITLSYTLFAAPAPRSSEKSASDRAGPAG